VTRISWAVAVVCSVAIAGVGGLWWSNRLPAPAAEPVPSAPAPAPAPEVVAAPPAIAYPLEAASGTPPAGFDLGSELAALVSSRAALSMFRLDDFPRRFVATVDNLGRPHATEHLWPVDGAQGHLLVRERDGLTLIDAANDARYERYVSLMEQVDPHRVVALYVRMYPALQSAYESLGYPHRYFNDRVVAVIDQLLATPDAREPLAVRAPHVLGAEHPAPPWKSYVFDDAGLEALSAGQKILLRMGPGNARRIKARLAEWRRILSAGAQAQR